MLNQAPDTLRYSRDVDLFHDSTGSLAAAAQADAATLTAHGFTVESKSHGDTFIRAQVTRGELETKIEWVNDSPFRFFPVEPDLDLGWRLNFWDAATNKVIAAASRRVFRDYLDVIHLHQHHLHLGALVWAAAAKDPGLSPEFIVDWISRNSKYRPEDFKDVRLSQPVDLVACKRTILDAIHEANQLFEKLPVTEAGCFYLDASHRPVCPDSRRAGLRRAHAPLRLRERRMAAHRGVGRWNGERGKHSAMRAPAREKCFPEKGPRAFMGALKTKPAVKSNEGRGGQARRLYNNVHVAFVQKEV